MPTAAIGAGLGAAGSIASGVGGKKSQNKANDLASQQLDLQRNQFGLAQQQLGMANKAIAPAQGYYNALLQGGQTARDAVGPYASLIGQAAQGTQNAIQSTTPRGGEQNLALAQNRIDQGNNIARLYAGMQPLAAQGLGQLAGMEYGSAGGFNPNANTTGAFGAYGQQQALASQAGSGYGGLLYNSLNKLQNGGGNNGGSYAGAVSVG